MLNELSGKRFAKLSLAQWLLIASAVILVTVGLFWWFGVQTQPKRVFNEMLEQSLRTNGVTLQAEQAGQSSDVAYWLQYSLGNTNQARSLTQINQSGAKVTTEVLGTMGGDYTRYNTIEMAPAEGNKPVDVSNIQNVWASGRSSLLAESALGLNLPLGALPVPIGNVSPEERAKLLQFINNKRVYNVDYDNVESKRVNGRLQNVYDVQIDMILYADLLKRFAKSVGLSQLDQLDPNSYGGAAPLTVKMTVDVRARHLVSVDVRVSEQQSYSYNYSGYDIPLNTDIPESTITDTELQQRVGELSNNEE